MKPHWNDAPKWANWLAQDSDGEWHWFANEPIEVRGPVEFWGTNDGSSKWAWARTTPCKDRWEETKEQRPC